MSDSNVVKLVDVAPGYVYQSQDDLTTWAKAWIEGLGSDRYEPLKAIVIVAETTTGGICVVSQSIGQPIDRNRLVGLLTCAAHWKAEGLCTPESIEVER